MEYNLQQQNALENGLHQILIANAGSGKTAVLVEKFYRLIAERPLDQLQQVVAITFTRKAASEMRERIVQILNKQIEHIGSVDKNEVYMKLIQMRERISSAKIQTIHSFCQEILSEFAVNIGYNPNFSVMEEYQFQKIYLEYFDDTLEDVVEFDENFKYLFEVISESRFKELVKMLVDNYLLLKEVEQFYSQIDNEIIVNILSRYIKVLEDFLNQNRDIIESNTNLFSKKNQDRIDTLHSILSNFDSLISQKNLPMLLLSFKDLFKLQYSGKSLYIKAVIQKEEYDFISNIIKEIETLTQPDIEQNIISFIGLMRNTIKFAKNLYNKIEKYKKRNSLITYNDMIYKVLELLDSEEILENLTAKYDYFLIDEFQDTDANQFAIFKKLAFSTGKTHKFLFLVGDPKQSIYGFRNADVRVINSASTLIETKNIELINNAEQNPKAAFHTTIQEQNYGKLELSNSYRLNLANAAFVNHIFSKIMINKSDTGFEVAYNPLIFSRENPYFDLNTNILSPYLSELYKFGSVKFLNTIIYNANQKNNEILNDESNNEEIECFDENHDKERDIIDEATSVSDYIKYIINNKVQIYDAKLKALRNIIFSDIAILVRKNSLINNLVKALDRNKIPFILTGVEDFFETQEIMDIISLLRFVNNPNDNYYFLATFKSYFFNLDDQTIYDIVTNDADNSKSFWQVFIDYVNKNINLDEKLKRAHSIINEIFVKREFLTVQDLITYILRATNFEEFFVDFPSKNIIYKNIHKFKTLVNRICSNGINSIGELLFELELVQESSEIISELDISTENAVNILTMHKAKGLEFPVVIIYHANFTNNPGVRLTFYDNKFPNIKYNLLGEYRQKANSPLYSIINNKQKLIEFEEEKRLFYVAATRAKDLLVISSLLIQDKDGNFAKSMYKGFGSFYFPVIYNNTIENGKLIFTIDQENPQNQITDSNNHLNFLEDQIISISETINISLPGDKKISQSLELPIEVLNNFRYTKDLDYVEINEAKDPILLIKNVEFPKQDQHISATKIQHFQNDKKRYFLRYITNFNTDFLDLLNDKSTLISTGLKGKERGTIIHNTIANIHNWYKLDELNRENLRKEITKNIFGQIQNETIDDIEEEIVRVFSEQFIKKRISQILVSQFEIPFYYYWNGRYVDVIFDLLYLNENGNREIWDWKNNYINSEEEYQSKVDYYSLQMKVYSLILSKQFPEQDKYVARLFFTRLAGKDERWMKVFEWSRDELIEFETEMDLISNQMYDYKSINFD